MHGSRLPQWYFVVPQRKPRVLQCYYSNTAGLEQPARQGCVGPWRLRHPPASSPCPPGERTTITARFTSFFRRAIFFSACNACVRAGGGRCGLPRQRSYACRRRRRRALAPGRSMGTIGRSRRLGTAWYNSVGQYCWSTGVKCCFRSRGCRCVRHCVSVVQYSCPHALTDAR